MRWARRTKCGLAVKELALYPSVPVPVGVLTRFTFYKILHAAVLRIDHGCGNGVREEAGGSVRKLV